MADKRRENPVIRRVKEEGWPKYGIPPGANWVEVRRKPPPPRPPPTPFGVWIWQFTRWVFWLLTLAAGALTVANWSLAWLILAALMYLGSMFATWLESLAEQRARD